MHLPRPPQTRPSLAATLVWRLRRRPPIYWFVSAVVAVVAALLASSIVADAQATRDSLGGLRPAVVATRSLPEGHRIGGGDTEIRELPGAVLPEGALAEPVDGEILAVPVLAGEVIAAGKLAPAGLGPVAALLPAGTRGLAIPDAGGLRLSRGDVVDVLATFPPEAAAGGDPTFAVATGAVVVDVAEGAVTVAVPVDDAPRVAFALSQGVVTLALSADR